MSASSREQILRRIRAAAGRDGDPADGPAAAAESAAADAGYGALPRGYLRAHHDPAGHDIVALFAERAADYRAVVKRDPGGRPARRDRGGAGGRHLTSSRRACRRTGSAS